MEKDQFQPIVDCFKENKKIESLTLVGVNGTKDNFTDLATALTANKGSAINTVDFSNNMLDDKGLTSISGWIATLSKFDRIQKFFSTAQNFLPYDTSLPYMVILIFCAIQITD